MKTIKLILMRHGESEWNKENRFTGWTDVELSQKGGKESKQAGVLLKKNGFFFDHAYTSVLKRSIHTLWNILDVINLQWIPVEKTWKLNERHYGKLQGLNKIKVLEKYGYEKVNFWRRDFNATPPRLTNLKDLKRLREDPRYLEVPGSFSFFSESLSDTFNRVVLYWNNIIKPNIIYGKKIIIVAHGNSLRMLIKFLSQFSNKKITEFHIPNAIPLVCELKLENESLRFMQIYYLQ